MKCHHCDKEFAAYQVDQVPTNTIAIWCINCCEENSELLVKAGVPYNRSWCTSTCVHVWWMSSENVNKILTIPKKNNSIKSIPQEAACKLCTRKNDCGIATCWNCGVDRPC